MHEPRYVVDPDDPRAPPQAVWDAMSPEERRRVLASLPSDIPRASPPEGDAHFRPKVRAREALDAWFRRRGRSVYLGSELPVYYPGEPMFAPDLIAVLDVGTHERDHWVVSKEQRGLDFVLEILVRNDRKKDLEENVERLARLGVPEYFVYEPLRRRITGYRLPTPSSRTYTAIVPQRGRWPSRVLELDLGLDEGRLRFFAGEAPLPDAAELIERLGALVDDAVQRAEEEARRAEEEARRAEEEARRAEEEARRAEEEARRAEEEARRAE
ncbi:MAG TPA: Uma2 family endonuclease, partial [Sandaracinaceae bacterium]